MCEGYSQVEGIGFDEIFYLVARMEAIRVLLEFSTHKDFKFYQMDATFVFLNGELEEVYIEKLEGFQLSDNPNML